MVRATRHVRGNTTLPHFTFHASRFILHALLFAFLVFSSASVRAQVYGFGSNNTSQLGDGTTTNRNVAVATSGLNRVVAVATGGLHSLAVRADGTVRSWGNNGSGQLGDGTGTDRSSPVTVVGMTNAVSVAAGDVHSMALRADGTVWAWGANSSGQRGFGNSLPSTTAAQIPSLTGVAAISAGHLQSMALRADGTVWTWGSNNLGQLGLGDQIDRTSPTQVPGLTNIVAVSMGFNHALALRADGTLWAWGNNAVGQLGTGNSVPSFSPVAVSSLTNVRAIAAGDVKTVAIRADGTVWSCGTGPNGNGGGVASTPIQLPGISNAAAASVGNGHNLILCSDGTVWGWGGNSNGQLGNGNNTLQKLPVQATGLTNITAISAGGSSSLVSAGGEPVRAFGKNLGGQVGDGTTANDRLSSVRVSGGLKNVVKVAGGANHSLALRADGTVWSWGINSDGQLGIASFSPSATPVQVSGLTNVIAIAAGEGHSLALKSDGTIWAWGRGNLGQLGNSNDEPMASPVQVSSLTSVIAIGAGLNHSLAVTADGLAWAWGDNGNAQLGTGSFGGLSYVPVQVSGLTLCASVAGGDSHSLALRSDGTVWAWGINTENQLNIAGSLPASTVPAQSRNVTFVTSISAGALHSIARLADGTVWSWGNNQSGQLGDGTTSTRVNTVQASGLTFVSAIDAGGYHGLARKGDGTVWAWGSNSNGRLGDGTTTQRNSAVQCSNVLQSATIGAGGSHSLATGYKFPVANAGPNQTVTVPHDGDPSTSTAPITLDGSASTDPNGDTLTVEWFENGVEIGVLPLVVTGSEVAGTWTFTLKLTDPDGSVSTDDVVITVNPEPNATPVAKAGPDQHVASSGGTGSFTLDGSASSDADGDSLTYSWKEGMTEVGTTATLNLTASAGPHTYTLTVTDPYGASASDDVIIYVNRPPVANAGPDQTVTVPHDGNPGTITTSVTLDGSGSSDPDGDTLTYEWRVGSIHVGSSAISTLGGVPPGTTVFTLTVTDPFGVTSSDTVTITVNPEPNAPPVANAGPDQTVSPAHGGSSASFTLNGSSSSDPDSDPLAYEWKLSGSVVGTTATLNLSKPVGKYTYTLKVTDAYGASSSDEVVITVNAAPNGPPVANAGPDQTVTVPHDGNPATTTATFTLDGSGSSDPDGDTLTYAWTFASIPVASKAVITLNGIPAGTYVFTLTVTDTYGASSSDDVTITVKPEPNSTPTANAGPDQTVAPAHGGTMAAFTLDGSSSSDPDGDTLTYEWKESGSVVGTASTLNLSKPVGKYTYTLKVTDPYGASSTDDVVITVNTAPNGAPVAKAGADQNLTVPHDGNPATNTKGFTLDGSGSTDPDGDTLTYDWKLGGSTVGSSATLSQTKTAGTYTYTLTVTDPYGGSSSDDVTVTINPEPNGTPTANAGPDQTVAPAHGGSTAGFTLNGGGSSDPDSDTLTYLWKEGANTVGSTASVNLTRAPGKYTFTLTVTDPYGASTSDDVVITVNSAPNGSPKANAGSNQNVTIPHDGNPATNTASFTLDGSGSSDPDSDTLTYEWKEGANVVGTTASVNLSAAAGVHNYTLKVTDPYGASDSSSVQVTVNAEPNGTPVSHAGADQAYTVAPGGTKSFTLDGSTSTDPDGDTLTYEWKLGGSVVGTSATLNPTKGAGTYNYTLKVTDPYGASSSDDVTVTITASSNRPPVANAGPDQHINSTLTKKVTLDGSASSDPDGDTLTYVWMEGGSQIATGKKPSVFMDPGIHTVTLTVNDGRGGTSSDDVVITIDPRKLTTMSLSYTPICTRGQVKDILAHLLTGNAQLLGKPITFYVDGIAIATLPSDNPTTFSFTPSAGMTLGSHTMKVRFEGDLDYQPSEKTGTLKLMK